MRESFLKRYSELITLVVTTVITIAAAAIVLYGNQREIVAAMNAQTDAFNRYATGTDRRLEKLEGVVFPPFNQRRNP